MNTVSLYDLKALAINRISWKIIACSSLALLWLTVFQDLLQSVHQDTSFYISESLLFRGVWLLFIPILFLQKYLVAWCTKRLKYRAASIVVTTLGCFIFHGIVFAVLVFLFSRLLFDHTYQIAGTLAYTLSEDLSNYVVVYGASGLYYILRTEQPHVPPPVYSATILVGTGQQKTIVKIDDIILITAASPYVVLHTSDKKYVHAESLKAMVEKLPAQLFIRIHKSCIVNRQKVVSYKSRLNGDYDIRLINQLDVRLSRNYVAAYKKWFG